MKGTAKAPIILAQQRAHKKLINQIILTAHLQQARYKNVVFVRYMGLGSPRAGDC